MFNSLRALYGRRYPDILVYMLQSTEYQVGPYLAWFWRTQDFTRVMYRRRLELTRAARLLRLALRLGIIVQLLVGILCILLWATSHFAGGEYYGLALIIAYPVVWAHLLAVPLLLGRWFIFLPQERQLIANSEGIFANHPGIKVAVAGSYGKTSMKELLLAVLGEGLKVAATPANKNVASSHAHFAAKLAGDEDVLIIEYGEGKPGDVAAFARVTHPTHAIITGLAPAHLDQYKTLAAAGKDIFSVADAVPAEQVYVNAESTETHAFMKQNFHGYDRHGALDWRVSDAKLSTTGTSFELKKGRQTLKLHSGLLGMHHVGPLSLAAALGLEFGLSDKQVVAGIAKTVAFEHRMQLRQVAGATVIDDTYNGNLEGIRAGTALLAELPAKRKLYVTPGLVDQGRASARVHKQVGELIAAAHPDIVVLMQNSATAHIQAGLTAAGWQGDLQLQTDPLDFYSNLDQFVAAGDVVVMQNDWTDNYA